MISCDFTSGGFNLTDDAKSAYLTQSTDILASDPLRGALGDNGGKTLTHALGFSSPAINTGFNFGQEYDQRGAGFLRTIGKPRNNDGDGTDIGAFEVQFIK